MNRFTLRRLIGAGAIAALLAACASTGGPVPANEQWAAHGYLTPGPTSEPEIIGVYDTERDCNDAVEAWMSQQVVGNPVSGECLPLDTH
ncbi:MAG: hypothetical protein KDA46_03675 [Parvularculaceae bacterium]|nr:hypothetical protein [Parvularculaceae bacterium]